MEAAAAVAGSACRLRKRRPTRSLDHNQTAWYQLVSAAGRLLDRFDGNVSDANRDDVWVLKSCVERVMEIENMNERPDLSDYEVEIE